MTLPKLPKLPEPAIGPSYSAYQMQIYAEKVMEDTIEACAKLADSMNTFGQPPDVGAAIRALTAAKEGK